MIYIARRNISFNDDRAMIKRGTIILLGDMHESALRKLEARGVIVEITFDEPPALSDVPGWERRTARFAKQGYETVMEVLYEDVDALAKKLRVKSPTVIQWREELKNYVRRLLKQANC